MEIGSAIDIHAPGNPRNSAESSPNCISVRFPDEQKTCCRSIALVHLFPAITFFRQYVQIKSFKALPSTPIFDRFWYFMILSTYFIPVVVYRLSKEDEPNGRVRKLLQVMKTRGWQYILVSLCLGASRYFFEKVKIYRTLTSGPFSSGIIIVVLALLSLLVLRAQYRALHYVGVVLCLSGLSCFLWVLGQDDTLGLEQYEELIWNYLGVLLSGVILLWEEYLVKQYGIVETLGMINFFAALRSGISMVVFEYRKVSEEMKAIFSAPMWPVAQRFIFLFPLFVVENVLINYLLRVRSALAVGMTLTTIYFYFLMFPFDDWEFHAMDVVGFLLIIVGLTVFSVFPTIYHVLEPRQQLEVNGRSEELRDTAV